MAIPKYDVLAALIKLEEANGILNYLWENSTGLDTDVNEQLENIIQGLGTTIDYFETVEEAIDEAVYKNTDALEQNKDLDEMEY